MSSILIIEDHILFSQTIQQLLRRQTDLKIVDTVPSGEAVLKKLPGLQVDRALVDVSLPGMSGIDLVEQIHAEFPHVRCLIKNRRLPAKCYDLT